MTHNPVGSKLVINKDCLCQAGFLFIGEMIMKNNKLRKFKLIDKEGYLESDKANEKHMEDYLDHDNCFTGYIENEELLGKDNYNWNLITEEEFKFFEEITEENSVKNIIEEAAELLGKTVSSFVCDSVVTRAKEVINEHRPHVVSQEQWGTLMDQLERPSEPNGLMEEVLRLSSE